MLALAGLTVVLAAPVALKAATLAPTGVTFTVTSTSDAVDANLANGSCAAASGACTLRAAIQQANALAGADTVEVPAGAYTLSIRPQNQNLAESGDLDVTGPVTIVGASAESTILDGGTPTSSASEIRGLDRLLEIHAGAGDVSLVGLSIREGYSSEQGGAIYHASSGNLRLQGVRVLDSYAAKYGGGIANAGSGRIELVGTTVSGNGAKEGGSAIHNAVAGTVSITASSAIADNPGPSASHYPITGSAINNEGDGDTIGTIEILDSTVARNESSSNGAGIYNERDGRVIVLRSTITGNRTSSSGAGIYTNSGVVLIRDSTITGNDAGNLISSGSGGGIYNAGQMSKAGTPGRLEIANSTITGNTATADGAGIHCGLDAELVITDSTISNNAAVGEGGGVSVQAKADMSVARTTFADNTAEVAGGGAYVYAEGTATFADATFVDNRAGETGGGGLLTDGSGSVSIVRSTFLTNRSVGDGGGLLVSSGGTQTIADSLVADNHTDEGGGGIFNSGMVVTFERLTITDNTALLDGGGIRSEGSGQFTILDTTVSGNTAENGGGFTNAADGTLSILRSTLRDNVARADGGGYLEAGDANSTIENSTLSGNRAGDRGGGLYTDADAELRVTNVTITDNTAHAGSGLSTSVESINFPVVPATRVILRNTIVAGNRDGINCHGAVFSEGGNLDDGTTCFFSDSRDLTRAGASLEPLAANGGATATHALKPSSVAIDRGVTPCPDADQRGVSRPQNARCDIGAYEFEGTPEDPDSDPLPPPTGPDSDPPTVTIDSKPPLRTLDRVAEFRFRADEIARYECVLNPPSASFSGCESPHGYANLQLGLQTFQVRAIDAAGNIGAAASYTWRIVEELDPPETSLGGGPTGLTRATGASFTFTASEPATFECSLDGAAFAVCASPLSLTGLGDGPHTFEVRAIDNSFNVDESPASRSWTVDTTPPETTLDSGAAGPTNDSTPAFAFSSEAGATFACRVDTAVFTTCASPHTTSALADGAHTFEVRAVDAAGNEDASAASHSFTVDTVAPDTALDSGPSGPTNDATPTFAFSSEAGATFQCRVDTAAFAACGSPHTTALLADGARTFEVRATDAAGNADSSAASRSFTLDTVAPETTIDSGPSGLTRATTATIAFSSNEAATFACSVDGGVFSGCTSPLELDTLADGPHSVEVRATDVAGNPEGSPASRAWTVDTTPPETTIDSGPDGPTNDPTPTFAFSSEAGATFECSLDGGELAACGSPLTTALLADGPHTVEVRAIDAAGNVDASPASRSFTVDTAPPTVTITAGPSGLTNDASPAFAFASEPGASLACRVDTAAFAACDSPHSTPALADGAHTFEVRATDAAGNTGETASRSFTVDTAAPETTIDSGPSGLTRETDATLAFSANEAATFECKLDDAEFASCSSPRELNGLAEGAHTFQVRTTDAAGNRDDSPATRTWTVDTTPPETTIDAGPPAVTNDATPTFAFSSEGGAIFECRVDAGAYAACTSPLTAAALADGAHTFEVRAVDAAGNVEGTPALSAFAVDTTAPETTIDGGPGGTTNDSTPTFAFSSEAGATFECSLDGGAFATCVSPHTTASLSDGAHTFAVRATDVAGNTDASPASRSFTLDATAPETTIDSGPSALTRERGATIAFSANEAATFECKLDDAEFASCSSPRVLSALADGAHTFQVRATDAAGNRDESPATRTWTVDATVPETTIDSGPSGLTSDPTPTFAFSSEAGATFECRMDGGTYAACSSPETTAALTDGAHAFEVRATDAAGNTDGTPASRAFTVDSVAPQTTIDSGPSGGTSDSTPTFAFSSEVGATFECRLGTDAFAACASPHTTATLTDGAYTFEVRARDTAGNVEDTPAARSFTVDATDAETTIDSGPSGPTNDSTPTFTFSSEGGAVFECRLGAAAFATCASPHTTAALADGPYTLEVRARDSAGNVDGSPASRSFTVDTAAPQTTIDTGPSGTTTGTSASFTFSANETATFACSLDTAPFTACQSGQSYSGLAVGSHQFRVQATDAAGNLDGSPASRSWTIEAADTTPPETTIDGGPSGPTNDSTPTFTFSSEAGATFQCRVDTAAFATCTSPHTTASLANGAHVFEVRARDAAANVDETPAGRSFTVDTVAPQTNIDSGPTDPTTQRGATFTFSANETVLRFECALDSAPFTTCASGISYMGPLALGDHEFRVRSVDLAGNAGATDTHTWTIEAAPPSDTTPPVVTISGPPNGTQETSATFTFSANEHATFGCRLDAATFDSCSSGITYSGLQPGEHVFRVEARDSTGNVSITSYTWTIVAAGSCTTGSTVTVAPNADTWLLESSSTSNYGRDSVIKVDTKAGANARALLRFALPAAPAGCTVRSATLRLYAGSYKTGRTLHAIPVASNWSHFGVTWATQPSASGGAPAAAPSAPGYVEWAVASHLAGLTQVSFLIKDATEGGNGVEQGFHSLEKAPDSPPQLVVTFG